MPKREVLARMAQVGEQHEAELEAKAQVVQSGNDLTALAQEMLDCKDRADELKAQAKEYEDRYNEIRKHLMPEAMEAAGLVKNGKGSFTFGGGKVHLETKLYASSSEANRDVFFSWLKENGHEDLIRETVNAQTLSAFCRERRADGLGDPPGVSSYEETVAKITKGK